MHVSLLDPARLRSLVRACSIAAIAPGSTAEVGVYRGGSALEIARALPMRLLYLFDTFEGLPEPGPEDGTCHWQGRFAAPAREVEDRLALEGIRPQRFVVKKGVFPESASGIGRDVRFAFVHVDVDLAASVRACCEWFAPRMSHGGIMLFDDYGCASTPGAKPVVDELLGDRVQDTGLEQAMVTF